MLHRVRWSAATPSTTAFGRARALRQGLAKAPDESYGRMGVVLHISLAWNWGREDDATLCVWDWICDYWPYQESRGVVHRRSEGEPFCQPNVKACADAECQSSVSVGIGILYVLV